MREKTGPDFLLSGNCSKAGCPDIMIPRNDEEEEAAKQICEGCMVGRACLQYALENRIKSGVWGGASEKERELMLRGQHQAL